LKQLIPASFSDFEFFYKIKTEDKNMKWTGHTEKPVKKSLQEWFDEKLSDDSDRDIYIYFINEVPVGYSYAIYETNYIETAVAISKEFEGFGYGREMVIETLNVLKDEEKQIVAWILDENKPSIKIHQNAGYIATEKQKNDEASQMTMYSYPNPNRK